MSNTIQIKRGSHQGLTAEKFILQPYELGYDNTYGILWIGQENGDPASVYVGGAGILMQSDYKKGRTVGDTNTPVYFDDGIPVACSSIDLVSKAQGLANSSGNLYSVGSSSQPVYFTNGIPTACTNFLPTSGGTISGELTLSSSLISNGLIVCNAKTYGPSLPTTDLKEGRLFFLIVG